MRLEIKNLVKKFDLTVAVNNISFEIEKNKTLGLLGPNGCGKTTSIGMMLGLITPTSGEIYINGISLNPKNRIELLSSMNFASPYIELPKKLTVKQNLEIFARLYGVKKISDRITEMSEDLNLKNLLNRKTGELSHPSQCLVPHRGLLPLRLQNAGSYQTQDCYVFFYTLRGPCPQ